MALQKHIMLFLYSKYLWHDGFRAMPSAAFWSESYTAADRIATD